MSIESPVNDFLFDDKNNVCPISLAIYGIFANEKKCQHFDFVIEDTDQRV